MPEESQDDMTTAAPPNFLARVGRSFALPTISITAYDRDGEVISGGLGGSVAVLTIGSSIGTPKLTIRSDDLIDPPAVFDWDDAAQTLEVNLSPEQTTTIGAGNWTAVLDIETDDDNIDHDVPTMTFGIEMVRWPAGE